MQAPTTCPDAATRPAVSAAQAAIDALIPILVAEGLEQGIQVAAYSHGELVVNAAGGPLRPGGPATTDRALFPVFAIMKGVVAVCAHLQAERGLLDLDAPIASYWPEFAAHGKQAVTLRDALTHRAGVPQMPPEADFAYIADWDRITGAIAALEPIGQPNPGGFYHGMTYGWIIAEAVRRSDPARRPFDRFVREEIATPLGMDDFYLTVPQALMDRVAVISGCPYPELPADSAIRVGMPPPLELTPDNVNRVEMKTVMSPATGGFGSARSTARFFAMLASGSAPGLPRFLKPETMDDIWRERPDGRQPDPFLGRASRLAIGGQILGPAPVVGSRENILFSACAGGTYAWTDQDHDLAVVILHNHMTMVRDPEVQPAWRIARTIRRELGVPE
jgi:CubicO group peptidase (beta-lactamase class C family)